MSRRARASLWSQNSLSDDLLAEWRAGSANPRVAQVLVGVRPASFMTRPDVEYVLTYITPAEDTPAAHAEVMRKLRAVLPFLRMMGRGEQVKGLQRVIVHRPRHHAILADPWRALLPMIVHGDFGNTEQVNKVILGYLVAYGAAYTAPIHVSSVGILEVAYAMFQLRQYMNREGLVFPINTRSTRIQKPRLTEDEVAVILWRSLVRTRLHYHIIARRAIEISEALRMRGTTDYADLPPSTVFPPNFNLRVPGGLVYELLDHSYEDRQAEHRKIYQAACGPELDVDFQALDQWRQQANRTTLNDFAFRLLVALVSLTQVLNETPAISLGSDDDPTTGS